MYIHVLMFKRLLNLMTYRFYLWSTIQDLDIWHISCFWDSYYHKV